MADDPTPTPKDGGEKTFTQAELDRIVEERLKRERAKYADYDQLKAQADKAKALEDEKKTGEERLAGEIKALKDDLARERHRALVAEIAQEKGLSAKQARRLQGATREELEADADDLLDSFGGRQTDGQAGDTDDTDAGDTAGGGEQPRRPKEKLRPGTVTDTGEDDSDLDPAKLAAAIPRPGF